MKLHTGLFAALLAVPTVLWAAPGAFDETHLDGDVGIGAVYTQNHVRGVKPKIEVVPYLAFDWGRAFARVDSFGVKTVALGYGHVEVVGQYRTDGYTSSVLGQRQNPVPLGVGTLQVTPIGAFWVQVLHDVGPSGGNLVQARYVAELKTAAWLTVYPEGGAEYQSQAYTRYYQGTTAADAAGLGQAYRPGAALNPFFGALLEAQLAGPWYANTYVRRTVVDHTIARSPLATGRQRDSMLLSLARRF